MNAKRFFYVCAGLFLLVAAYSIGAKKADAQAGGPFVGLVATESNGVSYLAITASGECYGNVARVDCDGPGSTPYFMDTGRGCVGWTYLGTILNGTVPAAGSTWSGVKNGYRK
jgi:hypothetical protein